MSIEALIATLEREARAQREALAEEAQTRVERLLQEAEAEAERRQALALEQQGEQSRRAADRELAEHRHRLLSDLLAARDRAFDRILLRADALIAGLDPTEYLAQVPAVTTAILSYLDGIPAVLTCPPGALAAVRAAAAGTVVRVQASPDAAPGIVGCAEDGSVTVDGSLRARLAALRPDLLIELARELGIHDEEASDVLG